MNPYTLRRARGYRGQGVTAGTVTFPTVSGISPSSGGTAGGDAVTITGTGFTGATSAELGGVPITSFVLTGDTTITGITRARVAGSNLLITVDGLGFTTGFTYADPFSPASLALSGWFEAGDLTTGTGAVWAGKASAGISGTTDCYIAGGNNIGYGVTLNGHQTMRVTAGTNTFGMWDKATHTTRRVGTVMAGLSGGDIVTCTMWALINLVSPLPAGAGVQADASLLGPYTQNMSAVMAGTVATVDKIEGYGRFGKVPQANVTPATWVLAQYRFNEPAGYVEIRQGSGSWTQVSGVSTIFNDTSLNGQWVVCGASLGSTLPCDVASMGVAPGILSDGDLDNVRAYLNDRYGLSL